MSAPSKDRTWISFTNFVNEDIRFRLASTHTLPSFQLSQFLKPPLQYWRERWHAACTRINPVHKVMVLSNPVILSTYISKQYLNAINEI